MILICPHSICLGNPNLGNFQELIFRNCASLLIRRRLGVEMGAGRWWRIEMADGGGEIGDGEEVDRHSEHERCSHLLSMLCYHELQSMVQTLSRLHTLTM